MASLQEILKTQIFVVPNVTSNPPSASLGRVAYETDHKKLKIYKNVSGTNGWYDLLDNAVAYAASVPAESTVLATLGAPEKDGQLGVIGSPAALYVGVNGQWAEISNSDDGKLLAANNLSDLANAATARTNLGVYSTTEVDTALATKQDNLVNYTEYAGEVEIAATSVRLYAGEITLDGPLSGSGIATTISNSSTTVPTTAAVNTALAGKQNNLSYYSENTEVGSATINTDSGLTLTSGAGIIIDSDSISIGNISTNAETTSIASNYIELGSAADSTGITLDSANGSLTINNSNGVNGSAVATTIGSSTSSAKIATEGAVRTALNDKQDNLSYYSETTNKASTKTSTIELYAGESLVLNGPLSGTAIATSLSNSSTTVPTTATVNTAINTLDGAVVKKASLDSTIPATGGSTTNAPTTAAVASAISSIKSSLASAYVYKGSVTNYSDLPSNLTSDDTGFVYNVVNAHGSVPAGTNYAWNGSSWDALGGDLSIYQTKAITLDAYSGETTVVAAINVNKTAIATHVADTANPHGVTKAQVGLDNVDNTSDLNKPISTATQTALNAKQDTLTLYSESVFSDATFNASSFQVDAPEIGFNTDAFYGTGIVTSIGSSTSSTKLPTEGAIVSAISDIQTDISGKQDQLNYYSEYAGEAKVEATSIKLNGTVSGTGITSSIGSSASSTKLPTEGAVVSALSNKQDVLSWLYEENGSGFIVPSNELHLNSDSGTYIAGGLSATAEIICNMDMDDDTGTTSAITLNANKVNGSLVATSIGSSTSSAKLPTEGAVITALNGKAAIDASNLSSTNVASWKTKLSFVSSGETIDWDNPYAGEVKLINTPDVKTVNNVASLGTTDKIANVAGEIIKLGTLTANTVYSETIVAKRIKLEIVSSTGDITEIVVANGTTACKEVIYGVDIIDATYGVQYTSNVLSFKPTVAGTVKISYFA